MEEKENNHNEKISLRLDDESQSELINFINKENMTLKERIVEQSMLIKFLTKENNRLIRRIDNKETKEQEQTLNKDTMSKLMRVEVINKIEQYKNIGYTRLKNYLIHYFSKYNKLDVTSIFCDVTDDLERDNIIVICKALHNATYIHHVDYTPMKRLSFHNDVLKKYTKCML